MRYSFEHLGRREFLKEVSVAGAAVLLGAQRDLLAAEALPETTKIRLLRSAPICQAPQCASEELLRAEGFPICRRSGFKMLQPGFEPLGAGQGDILSTWAPTGGFGRS